MQKFKYFRELLVSFSSPANRCSVCNSRSGEEIPRMRFPCQPGVPEVCRGLLRPSRQIRGWYINSCHIVNYQVSYHSTLWRISLMKEQFVVTYTILHSDIFPLLDSWVTNTRSLKTLCPFQIFFDLIFTWKRNMIKCWSLEEPPSFKFRIIYRWATTKRWTIFTTCGSLGH